MTDKDNISRRQWIKSAIIAAAAPAIISGLASCRPAAGGTAETTSGGVMPWPDDGKVISSLPGQIDCIGCDICMPCGYGVDIPGMFRLYNQSLNAGEIPSSAEDLSTPDGIRKASEFLSKAEKSIGDRHLAHRCVGCGHCLPNCPQKIKIVGNLRAIGSLIDLIRERQCL